jgi:hypothetical protein
MRFLWDLESDWGLVHHDILTPKIRLFMFDKHHFVSRFHRSWVKFGK